MPTTSSTFPRGSCDDGDPASTPGSRGGGGNLIQAKSASSAIGTVDINLVNESEYAKGDKETSYFLTGLLGCLKYVRVGIFLRSFLC